MFSSPSVFLLGVAIGSLLLLLGSLIGYWLGRRAGQRSHPLQDEQFLGFLRSMSEWTAEFSGDVHKVHEQLSRISEKVRAGGAAPDELLKLVSDIMRTNRQLQLRLDNTEKKLDLQTDQLIGFRDEARTDGLTGLWNRRAFDQYSEELFQQWQQQQRHFSMALIDIDHFKKINDLNGHPAGDFVLQRVAEKIRDDLSWAVGIARYGGEEFGLLTHLAVEDAALRLDRFRAMISTCRFEFEGKVIRVSLSAGIAQILPEEQIESLVRRADKALYTAKMQGRNRVCWHDGKSSLLVSTAPGHSPSPGHLAAPGHSDAIESSGRSMDSDFQAISQAAEAAELVSRAQERLRRIVEEESQRITER